MVVPFDVAWSVLKAQGDQRLAYGPNQDENALQGSSMFGMTMHPAIQGMVGRARQQGDFSINDVTSANQERARQEASLRDKQSGNAERYPELTGFGNAFADDFNQRNVRPSALNPYNERDMERGQMPQNTGMQTEGLAPSYNMGMGGIQDVAQPAPVGSQQYNFEQAGRFGLMQPTGSGLSPQIELAAPTSLATSQRPGNYTAVMGSM